MFGTTWRSGPEVGNERSLEISQVGGGRSRLAVGVDSVADTKPVSSPAMNGITELVPGHLLRGGKLNELILWLNKVVLDEKPRKYLLLEWCKATGVPFTKEMADMIKVEQYP